MRLLSVILVTRVKLFIFENILWKYIFMINFCQIHNTRTENLCKIKNHFEIENKGPIPWKNEKTLLFFRSLCYLPMVGIISQHFQVTILVVLGIIFTGKMCNFHYLLCAKNGLLCEYFRTGWVEIIKLVCYSSKTFQLYFMWMDRLRKIGIFLYTFEFQNSVDHLLCQRDEQIKWRWYI